MKKSAIISALAALALMAPAITYSEFIINDKDGWTNIRKAPDAKSEILGRAVRHQVFFQTPNCGGDSWPVVGNWIPVTVDLLGEGKNLEGYIFKNNITAIESFPVIGSAGRGNSDVFTAKKDSITVTMKTVRKDPHNEVAEEIVVVNGQKRTVIRPKVESEIPFRGHFSLYIGNDGALYLKLIHEAGEGWAWGRWYSIVNGEVVHITGWHTGC